MSCSANHRPGLVHLEMLHSSSSILDWSLLLFAANSLPQLDLFAPNSMQEIWPPNVNKECTQKNLTDLLSCSSSESSCPWCGIALRAEGESSNEYSEHEPLKHLEIPSEESDQHNRVAKEIRSSVPKLSVTWLFLMLKLVGIVHVLHSLSWLSQTCTAAWIAQARLTPYLLSQTSDRLEGWYLSASCCSYQGHFVIFQPFSTYVATNRNNYQISSYLFI